MDIPLDDSTSLLRLQREIEDMKDSIELAHQNNIKTQTQVGGISTHFNDTDERLSKLEREVVSLRGYTEDLENYCISLDTILRKHHLLLNGVPEKQDESVNLSAFRVLQMCFQDINLTDLDYCYRIGTPPPPPPGIGQHGKTKARPILVKLLREDHQRRVYRNRNVLRQTEEYASVYINEDLPQIITQRRADIRSVYLNAKEKGHEAKMIGTKVVIDDVTYQHRDLGALPQGLRLCDAKMVKVKGGFAFATANAYFSNFYRCDIRYNSVLFDSAERAYQFERCKRLGAPEAAQQVLDARGPQDCKRVSSYIKSNNEWDSQKRGKMKEIVLEKFSQNDQLLHTLLLTGNKNLIEATTDTFWGAAAVIGSKLLKNGTWKGRNELGSILTEVREDLKREYNWVQMRADSSSDDQADLPPGTQSISEHDIDSFSQSFQNVSVRRSNLPGKKKKGKNKNRKSGEVQSVGNTDGIHPVSVSNQYAHATAHVTGSPGDVSSNTFAAPPPQSWFPMHGPQLGFPAPNFGIPPPGLQPHWPWPLAPSPYLPQTSQPTQSGMMHSQPWNSNASIYANTPQVLVSGGTLQDSTGTNYSAPSYSNAVANPNSNRNSMTTANVSHYGLQKRMSLRSGKKAGHTHNAPAEVRRKTMPPTLAPTEENLTVRIGSQAI